MIAVSEIDTFVIIFPNEEWTTTASDTQLNSVVAQLRPNISFAQTIANSLQTLSTHNADLDGTISGFLYVPDLSIDDACYNTSMAYVPQNVTRQANLPPTDFTLVSLAPWISAECTLSYLSAASHDPARAFIFYPPNNSTDPPPSSSDSFWDLGDRGVWRNAYQFPIYAMPGAMGEQLMHELSLYSGNMTDVPYGHLIAELPGIDPRDYVRLYTELSVGPVTTMPSLWVFLVIILAVLFLILGTTSASMHWIQRARRKSLRRRVANGEVDLEALGIKRLTVPQVFIDRLPLFTYSAESEPTPPGSPTMKKAASIAESTGIGEVPTLTLIEKTSQPTHVMLQDESKSNHGSIIVHKFLPYSQPTCPICLENYLSGESEIRELPCGHIFHPDCIDTFLSNNSSLCPMCKKSVLPIGFCPTDITNAMVRRERNLRRLRPTVNVTEEVTSGPEANGARARIRALKSKIKRRVLTAPPSAQDMPLRRQSTYMTSAMSANAISHNSVSLSLSPNRERLVVARLQELANEQPSLRDPDMVRGGRRPAWRGSLAKIFPGFS